MPRNIGHLVGVQGNDVILRFKLVELIAAIAQDDVDIWLSDFPVSEIEKGM